MGYFSNNGSPGRFAAGVGLRLWPRETQLRNRVSDKGVQGVECAATAVAGKASQARDSGQAQEPKVRLSERGVGQEQSIATATEERFAASREIN